MKQYQSTSEFVVSMQTPDSTTEPAAKKSTRKKKKSTRKSNKPQPIEIKTSLRPESRSSSAASSLSLYNGSVDSYWPEFHQNYNSIMDNTNLLDSCAAALSDITYDDELTLATVPKDRNHFIFMENSSGGSGESSSDGGGKHLSPKDIESFTRWLCEMELRVARQPTMSQIFAMNSSEMAQQLKVNSKIFNDIVAQPCIIKGSVRPDYKSIEERYHLLYLKAYEVLLLLEGLPIVDDSKRANSNKILNRSFYDIDNLNNVTEEENSSECEISDRNDSSNSLYAEDNAFVTNQANNIAGNCATYYFSYEQKDQPHHNKLFANHSNQIEQMHCESPHSDVNSLSIDKELTFSTFNDNDIQSYLNCSDNSFISNVDDRTLVTCPLEQSPMYENKEVISKIGQHANYNIDFYFEDLIRSPILPQLNETVSVLEASAEDLENKVQNWLNFNSNDSKAVKNEKCGSSWSVEHFPVQNECQVLYKTRSESDLRLNNLGLNKWSSLHTSINRLPRVKLPTIPSSINDSFEDIVSDNLEWDNFQSEYEVSHSIEENSDDIRMSNLARKLCEFGNDYSLYLNTPSVFADNDDNFMEEIGEDDEDLQIEQKEVMESETKEACDETGFKIRTPLHYKKVKPKRRQLRNKNQNIVKRSETSIASTPILTSSLSALSLTSETSKYSSESLVSTATFSLSSSETNPVTDNIDATIETVANQLETELTSSSLSVGPFDLFELDPEPLTIVSSPKIIKYDSADDNFEVYAADKSQPKKLKVSELKPEDFYDIIKICQNNIDCVITVLGAEPNRELTVHYCQKMKYERQKRDKNRSESNDSVCRKRVSSKSKDEADKVTNEPDLLIKIDESTCVACAEQTTCLCAWISETVMIILDFVLDIWNIIRNMRLYMYLCKFIRELFGSSRHVAKHLKMKKDLINSRAIAYC